MKSTNLHKQKNAMPGAKVLLAIVAAFCFGHTQSFAQMKVGNNPTTVDPSSVLEIEATNQGILLPRISIGNIATWGLAGATPVNGMFVYNSNAATTGGSGIGIYYWANLKWNYVQNGAAAANTAWLLTGNSTTTPGTYAVPGTNFIGTIDGVDFAVRTSNAERMRISAAGQIGMNQNFVATNQLGVTTAVAANTAIVGQNTSTSGASAGYGVKGTNSNATGIAILGQNTFAAGTGGNAIGVEGLSAQAYNAGTGTNGFGVVALNSNASGTGLYAGGNNTGLNSVFIVNGSGATMVGSVGGFGYSSTASGIGIYGVQDNTTQFQRGVYGTYNAGGYGVGVVGIGAGGSSFGAATTLDIGVYGSALDYSVMGYNTTGGIGVYGYSEGSSTGVFGINNDASSMGIFGKNTNALGTAIIGGGNNLTPTYFVSGQGGAFTGSSIGASGYLPTGANGGLPGSDYSTGSYGFFGRADAYFSNINSVANLWQFGVYGEKIGWNRTSNPSKGYTERRSGGVLGSYYDQTTVGSIAAWGSLGYVASATPGTAYGLYSSTAAIGGTGGFTSDENPGGVGIGSYGGIMGGWVRGNVYGMNIKGERYGLYIDGYTYSNKPSVQLIDNGGSERTVAYNVSSLSPDVYAHGKGKMVNGKAQITFDRGFAEIVDESDLAVTVTPIGESNGVHLVASTGNGFSLQENKNADNSFGSSDAEFTWIAVGKRKDVKSSDIAKEVLDKNFDENMDGVMFNENDKAHDAGGMEWTKDGLKFYPITSAETSVVGNKSALLKTAQVILPKNSNLKGDELKMEKPEQEKNKVIVNKNSTGQKSDPPPAPKKD